MTFRAPSGDVRSSVNWKKPPPEDVLTGSAPSDDDPACDAPADDAPASDATADAGPGSEADDADETDGAGVTELPGTETPDPPLHPARQVAAAAVTRNDRPMRPYRRQELGTDRDGIDMFFPQRTISRTAASYPGPYRRVPGRLDGLLLSPHPLRRDRRPLAAGATTARVLVPNVLPAAIAVQAWHPRGRVGMGVGAGRARRLGVADLKDQAAGPPRYGPLAGNHVAIESGSDVVLLAHLRRGSVLVRAGDDVRHDEQAGRHPTSTS